ncbi:unnamed protein product [Acanthoscelides obtectus]|uniref:Uncharacterized protein n=1 Tax=Acanthoscelides obtectus TaxID=200917 RepID=A0A9P0PZZ4_ACAOB|nr:unnamed protein product [Acanthoscelides obtectus]CAK1637707.1 hypothetical protein AOBTE_LOCUS10139 [Acanthoscelides obtectus]
MKFSKLSANFLIERNLKDEKYITVYDQYTPDYTRQAVTGKFYSKFELKVDEADPAILKKLEWVKDFGPRQKREWPETMNQWYGWYLEPLVPVDKSNKMLYYPQASSELTKVGLQLLKEKTKKKQ